jgi:hypothetical protein
VLLAALNTLGLLLGRRLLFGVTQMPIHITPERHAGRRLAAVLVTGTATRIRRPIDADVGRTKVLCAWVTIFAILGDVATPRCIGRAVEALLVHAGIDGAVIPIVTTPA